MVSQCHTAEPVPQHLADPALAAARSAILDLGLRRTTLAEVARRAGLSRMTLYRQHGDLDTIVSTLLTAEFSTEFTAVQHRVAGLPTARARLVEATVQVLGRIAEHPLLRRVLDVDPELLLPLIVDRVGSTQRIAQEGLAALIDEGRRDGSVRAVDPVLAAAVIATACQSFVFSARVVEREHDPGAVGEQLRLLLDRYLAPGAGEQR